MAKLKLRTINIPVAILRENKRFVAYSPALDLSTSGRNYKEAKKRFEEIVEIFFEELIKKGTLEEVLGELGWKKVQSKLSPPIVIAQESQAIRLPIHV